MKLRRRSAPRTMLPSSTRPPSRIRVPGPRCFSAMSLGELKNAMEPRNALSISATATASTPSPAPIKTRRRCLRVMPTVSVVSRLASTLQPKTFDQVVDPLDVVGTARERVPRVGGGVLSLVAVAEHGIGAHELKPIFDVTAIGMEAVGQSRHHAADHLVTLRVA